MRDVKNYEGQYSVTKNGKIWSHKTQKFLKLSILKGMYYRVGLRNSKLNNERKLFLVHRLVATAFIKNQKNKKEVNHINSNGLDNNMKNLEWVSRSENNKHAWVHGKKVFVKTEKFIKSVRKNAAYARTFIGRN